MTRAFLASMTTRLVFLFSFTLFATGALHAGDMTLAQREALAGMRNLVDRQMKVLDHDLVTFHYENEKSYPSTPQELSRQPVFEERFFDSARTSDDNLQGPGYYVSVDASGSRMYGEGAPKLVVMTVKHGSRIFDGTPKGREIPGMEKALVDFYGQFKCGPFPQRQVANAPLWAYLKHLRDSPSEECRQAFIGIFKDLRVQAMLFGYPATDLKGCESTRRQALNLISVDAVEGGLTVYFSHDRSFDPHHMGGYIKRLYDEGRGTLVGDSPAEQALPKTLDDAPEPSESEYAQWKSKNIYKCGSLPAMTSPETPTAAGHNEAGRQ
jgi:hypothetical protein